MNTISKLKIFLVKHSNAELEKAIGLIAAVLVLLGFYLLYFNNTLPVSEGWPIYYSELMDKGYFPYRDFYYYMPPLGLLIDYILWKCSFGMLIVFRAYYLLERLLMISVMYFLLCRRYKPILSSMAVIFGGIVGGSAVYDLIGDYNQTAIFFLIIMMFFAVKYVESNGRKQKNKNLFFLGLFFGLSFLIKQSTGVAAGIVYLLGFVIYCYKTKNKDWFKELMIISGTFLLCILVLCVVLLFNKALIPFVKQVFLSASGSKGGLKVILFDSIFNVYNYHQIVVVLAMFAFTVFVKLSSEKDKNRQNVFYILVSALVLALTLSHLFSASLFEFLEILPDYKELLVVFLAIIIALYYGVSYFTEKKDESLVFAFIVGIVMELFIIYINFNNINERVYKTTLFETTSPMLYIAIVLIAMHFLYLLFYRESVDYSLFMIDIGVLSGVYSCIMNCGTSDVPNFVGFILIPPVLCSTLSFSLRSFHKLTKIKNVLLLLICLLVSFSIFSRKYCCAYSWWGTKEDRFYEKTETIDIDFLKGFKVSKQTKLTYEKIDWVLRSNMDQDDIIWSFPFCKIFNLTTGHIGENGFVPVLFYDVCPDDYAIEDAKLLEKNMPDFIIWSDIPYCLEVHESAFRSGEKCGQRELIKLVQRNIRRKNYVLVAQVGDTYVYQKREKDINASYIQDKEKENITLNQKY